MKIVLNGRIIEEQEAVVSVYDHGFLYGIGLFETFRTYGGQPFLLGEHLARLGAACRELGIAAELSEGRIAAHIAALLQANGLADGYFRLSVSAGEGALGLPSEDYHRPNVILYVKPLPERKESLYLHGKALQRLALRRNTPEGAIRFKSFHYMNNVLAKREMARYPWAAQAEGLFVTSAGHVAEGIVSNVFFVREGRCYTPSLETGILPGITRAYVMRLLRDIGIPTEEGLFRWEQLVAADEVFVTNSIQEAVPVSLLFDESGIRTELGVGPVARGLAARYGR